LRITIIGRPASGKSTLTDRLVAASPELRTFGVRRHFTKEVEAGTPIGERVRDIVARHGWIPDELVAATVREHVASGALGTSFILEGMPGNLQQAELLDELLGELGLPLHGAVHVATPEEVCSARATSRLVCYRCDGGSHEATRVGDTMRCARCGGPVTPRDSDAQELFSARLTHYRELGRALVGYYTGDRLLELDGRADPEDSCAAVRAFVTRRSSTAVPA